MGEALARGERGRTREMTGVKRRTIDERQKRCGTQKVAKDAKVMSDGHRAPILSAAVLLKCTTLCLTLDMLPELVLE